MMGEALARAAEGFVGVPFRLHGRDPASGLDCVGLIAASLALIGRAHNFPNGYAIRTGHWDDLENLALAGGFDPASDPIRPGDVLLLCPSAVQMHFAIVACEKGMMIEAHAGLRRIVASPMPDPVATIARWRLRPEPEVSPWPH